MKSIKLRGTYQVFDFKISLRVLTLRRSFIVDEQYFNNDIKFIGVQHLNVAIDMDNILIRLAREDEQIDIASKGYFDTRYANFLKIYVIESDDEGLKQDYFVVAAMIEIKETYLAPIPLE